MEAYHLLLTLRVDEAAAHSFVHVPTPWLTVDRCPGAPLGGGRVHVVVLRRRRCQLPASAACARPAAAQLRRGHRPAPGGPPWRAGGQWAPGSRLSEPRQARLSPWPLATRRRARETTSSLPLPHRCPMPARPFHRFIVCANWAAFKPSAREPSLNGQQMPAAAALLQHRSPLTVSLRLARDALRREFASKPIPRCKAARLA